MEYCRYSAMPVGRFVLDVHGESRRRWPASDALCAALQVINHLQDCAKDYRDSRPRLRAARRARRPRRRCAVAGEPVASPELRGCLASLAERTAQLMPEAEHLPERVRSLRLGLETAVIVRLANVLLSLLEKLETLSASACIFLRQPLAGSRHLPQAGLFPAAWRDNCLRRSPQGATRNEFAATNQGP